MEFVKEQLVGPPLKHCVFCGQKPDEKTLEHVLPRWLIEHTGDPKRTVQLGQTWKDGPEKPQTITFAFDQFRFPACRACNGKFSKLESDAKRIILSLETHEDVSIKEVDTLLDWFDKVRVGLWLGSRQLGTALFRANAPKFFIENRMRHADRSLFITRFPNTDMKGLSFFGTQTPIFGSMPSVFGLRINDLFFINASRSSLFSMRAGWPFVKDIPEGTSGLVRYRPKFFKGTERQMPPLIPYAWKFPCLRIYQPIVGTVQAGATLPELLTTSWMTEQLIGDGSTAGRLLIEDRGTLRKAEKIGPLERKLMIQLESSDIVYKLHRSVLELQIIAAQNSYWGEELSRDDYRARRTLYRALIRFNQKLIKANFPSRGHSGITAFR